jgi:hypothetical protein
LPGPITANGSPTAEWLIAVGTIGAVLTALGLQWWGSFREKRRRPVLSLSFDEHKFQDEKNAAGATVPYLRMALTNAQGKDAARDVQVLVTRVSEVAGGGVQRWLVNPALGWPNSLNPVPIMTIPAGATRYVDIGCWMQGSMAPLDLTLAVVPTPNSDRHRLPPGKHQIYLSVIAANADARSWVATVAFGDEWSHGLAHVRDLEASVEPDASSA